MGSFSIHASASTNPEKLTNSISNSHSIKRDGITWYYLISYLFSIVFIICSFVFMNVGQSFILREIDPDSNIIASAMTLVFYDELLAVSLIGIWGHVSDIIGRKYIYASGFALIMFSMVSCALFVDTVFPEFSNLSSFFSNLLIYRLVFACGCSMVASLMTAFLSDIATPVSTGRLAGLVGIASCIGGFIGAVLFPSFSIKTGFLSLAGCLFLTCISILLFFKDLPDSSSIRQKRLSIIKAACVSITAAKNNRHIALAYFNAIVSRSVTMINTTLLEAWVCSFLVSTPHIPSKPIVIRLNGVLQGTSLFMAPVFGMISSKKSPVIATFMAAILCLVGDFLMVAFVSSPVQKLEFIVMFIKGAGQIGLIVSGMALASRHSPTDNRGAISSAYGFFGALGIIINSKLAMWLGLYSSSNPFLILLAWESMLAILSLITFYHNGKQPLNTCNMSDKIQTSHYATDKTQCLVRCTVGI